MSVFAPIKRERGIRMIRSVPPHPASLGSLALSPVMSSPMMAKSPFESSKISGHASVLKQEDLRPRRRMNVGFSMAGDIHPQKDSRVAKVNG